MPIGGTNNDVILVDVGSIAEDAHASFDVSFPDGAKLYLVDAPDNIALRLRLYTIESIRDNDVARDRNDFNYPDGLLLDTEVTALTSYERAVVGDVTISLALLGDLRVYGTLTRYEPGTGSTRAQIYYSVPSGGPAA